MEKARLKSKEVLDQYNDGHEYSQRETLQELKPEINNLLHQYLPDDVTIKEAEILAMVMLDMITDPHSYIRQKN